MSTRASGEHAPGLAQSARFFNVGDHVGDDLAAVTARRQWVAQALGAPVVWLRQVHGHRVVRLSRMSDGVWIDDEPAPALPVDADGSFTTVPGVGCAVMVADCLPVLLALPGARGVAALHAGWRGLLGEGPGMAGVGILENGVRALCQATGTEPEQLQAWLGPCIGPQAFEVGEAVAQAVREMGGAMHCLTPLVQGNKVGDACSSEAKWLADLPALARLRLARLGVTKVSGGDWCTFSDAERFFSFRRDRVTGRHVACIAILP